MPTKQHPPEEREAFCLSCPDPQEVTTFLKNLGLHLVLSRGSTAGCCMTGASLA
jgi:hypothetical protein